MASIVLIQNGHYQQVKSRRWRHVPNCLWKCCSVCCTICEQPMNHISLKKAVLRRCFAKSSTVRLIISWSPQSPQHSWWGLLLAEMHNLVCTDDNIPTYLYLKYFWVFPQGPHCLKSVAGKWRTFSMALHCGCLAKPEMILLSAYLLDLAHSCQCVDRAF